ncbi:MAG: DUF1211 domain-containing protein [Flavobacteriales bacterium]|nr:DUF1211 domain-containing protein [Flavobacteriales bacterium]
MLARNFKGPAEKIKVGTHRLEALGDGIFAIVMTLMVLELKIPEWEGEVTNARVWHYLVELAPSFFAFALSFVILGICWFAHRLVHVFVGHSNRRLIWLSILFYLCICLIPFSAAMLGRYPENQLVEIIYGVNLVAACQFLYWLWNYANSLPGLMVREVPQEVEREIHLLFLLAPAMVMVAIGISFVEPIWSFYFYLVAPLFYLIPTKLDKYLPHRTRKGKDAEGTPAE